MILLFIDNNSIIVGAIESQRFIYGSETKKIYHN